MSGPERYAELSAAVRALKGGLIQASQVERLVEAGSLSETVSIVTSGQITSVDSSNLAVAESELIHRAAELTKRLASYALYDSRALIRLFSSAYELACVKEILRSILDQEDPEDAVAHIVPSGKYTLERCKELIEAHNLTRVVDTLEDDALKRFIAPMLVGEKTAMAVVAAIDQYYYSRLWSASNLPDLLDARSARGLIGELIDRLNILLAFRARLIGLDARSTADLFIPVNYALGHSLTELAESTNISNLLRAVEKTRYAHDFDGYTGLEASVSKVERALNRSHARSCINTFAGSPFKVGLALAFLFLKNYELHDLFAIFNGKANNVAPDHILESLILRGI
jgi:vacuolar-type H+-ATPase subunit C/Vma6